MKKTIVIVGCVSILSGIIGSLLTFTLLKKEGFLSTEHASLISLNHETPDLGFTPQYSEIRPEVINAEDNFVFASEQSKSSVVFIQTLSEYEYRTGSWLDWFFEPRASQQISSGSGVILSEDGYIITNNHVVDDADIIKVVHGKKTYDGKLMGTDPSTDLAVIKVNQQNLPAIKFGNSDDVNVGEWVLAVGNPFNLTSTVTAGIVSAKGRNINILRDKFPIESFIQTDAAINPGNSGGALVNTQGNLIGINTAILSRTGSYTGYGFAVPSNIVKKVFEDIKNYGEVQKAFIGAEFIDINSELATKMNLEDLSGVIVANVQREGAAAKGNLEKGDVIREINGRKIDSKAFLEEYMGNMYPGEEIKVLIEREGTKKEKKLTLTNREGTTGIIRRDVYASEWLDATFESVPKVERDLLGIKSGVKVVDYKKTGIFAKLGIAEGFIITHINNTTVESPAEFSEILERIKGRVIISGIDKHGRNVYYPYFF
ncbi:trypsin-like peptidase domain-containing protein [Marinoscillum sp. 108]|jgi:Do/DeqQ family serine protease|uniref:trypsin-like peptidase domain-containing protein n=1 Tax=Marinoscillum sp. 108 TaxID=2653151 RepID=UPI0012F2FD3C|nr:trypsin-like peptidase domain-containing protein [Marinoscillum sp. 108]VXD16844.1 Do/DeqQ family serine protease [Marinoscillum sp. 108]